LRVLPLNPPPLVREGEKIEKRGFALPNTLVEVEDIVTL